MVYASQNSTLTHICSKCGRFLYSSFQCVGRVGSRFYRVGSQNLDPRATLVTHMLTLILSKITSRQSKKYTLLTRPETYWKQRGEPLCEVLMQLGQIVQFLLTMLCGWSPAQLGLPHSFHCLAIFPSSFLSSTLWRRWFSDSNGDRPKKLPV